MTRRPFIFLELPAASHERDMFREGGGNQHPVKRVHVAPRQGKHSQHMMLREWNHRHVQIGYDLFAQRSCDTEFLRFRDDLKNGYGTQ